jgi:chromosome segregation ATPase
MINIFSISIQSCMRNILDLLLSSHASAFMEQLTILSVKPRDQDSAAKSLTALKSELEEEKAAREKAQVEVETLAWVVDDLKKSADRFATQIPILEEKVKHLDNKVLDMLNDACANEVSLEQITKANEDYKNQNTQLTKKVESKLLYYLSFIFCSMYFITNPTLTHRI